MLCKNYIEYKTLHPDIKRFTYDAIKFNVDKMTKV